MKFSLACLASAAVANERKFSNNDDFMASGAPSWWDDHTPAERHAFLYENTNIIFRYHLYVRASRRLKPLFVNLIDQMAKIEQN